jgi:hypothetical protein
MNPIDIDFVADKRWRWVWAAAAFCALCLASVVALYWHKTNKALQDIESRTATSQQQITQLNARRVIVADPRQASAEQAVQLLQQDLNKVFASAENLKETGVRLRGVTLDGSAGVLRLEFELDAMPSASIVTTSLNSGYENRPWQLESVTGAGGGGGQIGFASGQVVRGLWFVQVGKL